MPAPEQMTLQQIVDVADVDLRAFLESEIRSARLTPGEGRELLLETLPGWAEPYENASATVAADCMTRSGSHTALMLLCRTSLALPRMLRRRAGGFWRRGRWPRWSRKSIGIRRSRRSWVVRIGRLLMRTGTRRWRTRLRIRRRVAGSGWGVAVKRVRSVEC